MTQAVFRSVHQALHVAFLMAVLPPTQKSNTQALIEQLMRDAGVLREVEHDGTLNFQGLSPLEVRGQCAMVRGAVEHHCTEPERMAIWAWFAHDENKARAISYLCDWCTPYWTVESRPARMMMTWRANLTEGSAAARQCSVRDVEGEFGIPKSTAHRNVLAVSKACRGLREQGINRLTALFESGGLCDSPSVEAMVVSQ